MGESHWCPFPRQLPHHASGGHPACKAASSHGYFKLCGPSCSTSPQRAGGPGLEAGAANSRRSADLESWGWRVTILCNSSPALQGPETPIHTLKSTSLEKVSQGPHWAHPDSIAECDPWVSTTE